MRVAVVGATGNIGARTVVALERDGHDVVPISRSHGVDVTTGDGLDAALEGVGAVVDALNAPYGDEASTVAYFTRATENLLAAEEGAGVGHHVLLSIVGLRRGGLNAHRAGKLEQERLVTAGPVPWSIVPTTQFHDFAATVASWSAQEGVAEIAPLLVQPVAPDDVAAVLAAVATGAPVGRHRDVAGPERHDLVDMARRTFAAQGREVRIVPTWRGEFGTDDAGEVLLPAADALVAPTTFDRWLEGVRAGAVLT